MSGLKERITEDMKAAMRARETERLGTIRLLLAAIKQREVDERIELDDAAVAVVIDKLAGRQELVEKEESELTVLHAYMPQQLSAAEIEAEVAAAVAQLGATGPQDMGKVMGALKGKLAGKADMTAVSAQVKAALSPKA
jgi:uncharacterized protein YqeY